MKGRKVFLTAEVPWIGDVTRQCTPSSRARGADSGNPVRHFGVRVSVGKKDMVSLSRSKML